MHNYCLTGRIFTIALHNLLIYGRGHIKYGSSGYHFELRFLIEIRIYRQISQKFVFKGLIANTSTLVLESCVPALHLEVLRESYIWSLLDYCLRPFENRGNKIIIQKHFIFSWFSIVITCPNSFLRIKTASKSQQHCFKAISCCSLQVAQCSTYILQ